MKTPVVDFVKRYACGGFLRLHMPGHKGKGFIGVEQNDITEIDGADVLYNSQGIIRRSVPTKIIARKPKMITLVGDIRFFNLTPDNSFSFLKNSV